MPCSKLISISVPCPSHSEKIPYHFAYLENVHSHYGSESRMHSCTLWQGWGGGEGSGPQKILVKDLWGVLSGACGVKESMEGALLSEALYHGTSPGRRKWETDDNEQADTPRGPRLSRRVWGDRSHWQQWSKGRGPHRGTYIWKAKMRDRSQDHMSRD